MREFVKVAADYPQVISAVDRHAVFKARQFMLKEKHTALVKELIEEIKAMPVQPWDGKKVVVTGILLEPNQVLEIFDEFKLAIVDDDLAQESRQIRVDVLDGEEGPLYRMAKAWQQMYGCYRYKERPWQDADEQGCCYRRRRSYHCYDEIL